MPLPPPPGAAEHAPAVQERLRALLYRISKLQRSAAHAQHGGGGADSISDAGAVASGGGGDTGDRGEQADDSALQAEATGASYHPNAAAGRSRRLLVWRMRREQRRLWWRVRCAVRAQRRASVRTATMYVDDFYVGDLDVKGATRRAGKGTRRILHLLSPAAWADAVVRRVRARGGLAARCCEAYSSQMCAACQRTKRQGKAVCAKEAAARALLSARTSISPECQCTAHVHVRGRALRPSGRSRWRERPVLRCPGADGLPVVGDGQMGRHRTCSCDARARAGGACMGAGTGGVGCARPRALHTAGVRGMGGPSRSRPPANHVAAVAMALRGIAQRAPVHGAS